MTLTAVVPTSTAIFLSLFAAFLWGTWLISVKYLGDYPVDGFYMVLFATSIVFVWGLGFLLEGRALLENFRSVYLQDPSIITVSFVCGCIYVIGIRISLTALQQIGFSISQPIQASFNILLGTLISGLIGGIPANVNPMSIALACLLLFAAVFVSMIAGNLRSKELRAGAATSSLRSFSPRDLWRSMGLLVLSSAFIQAYTFGLSYGLRTISHPKGLAVMPFMALLSTGAFIGALFTSGLVLTVRRQWKLVWCAPFSIQKFGILAGVCHYGGNIIHTIGTAALSSVISWPLGVTMGLWTQFWGLMYGEFKGASWRTYAALFAGIALYLFGTYLVGIQGQ